MGHSTCNFSLPSTRHIFMCSFPFLLQIYCLNALNQFIDISDVINAGVTFGNMTWAAKTFDHSVLCKQQKNSSSMVHSTAASIGLLTSLANLTIFLFLFPFLLSHCLLLMNVRLDCPLLSLFLLLISFFFIFQFTAIFNAMALLTIVRDNV